MSGYDKSDQNLIYPLGLAKPLLRESLCVYVCFKKTVSIMLLDMQK